MEVRYIGIVRYRSTGYDIDRSVNDEMVVLGHSVLLLVLLEQLDETFDVEGVEVVDLEFRGVGIRQRRDRCMLSVRSRVRKK